MDICPHVESDVSSPYSQHKPIQPTLPDPEE